MPSPSTLALAALAAAAAAAAADYNTVLQSIYTIGNQTQTLTSTINTATTGVGGIVPALNIQDQSVTLDETIQQAVADATASSAFGDDGSTALAVAVVNLEPSINASLSALVAQRQTLDTYRPIVLASLYQLKQDTDAFGAAIVAKGNSAIQQAGPIVIKQIDGFFDTAIKAYVP